MYEYKIFHAEPQRTLEADITVLNSLLESLSRLGWEPVEVNLEQMHVLAKRKKNETLHD